MTHNRKQWYRVERPILLSSTEIYYIKAESPDEAIAMAEFSYIHSWGEEDFISSTPNGDFSVEEMSVDDVPFGIQYEQRDT